MLYSDFSFTDYVGVSVECDDCQAHSPEFQNVQDLIIWVEEHMGECIANA